jgi:cytochrome b561
MLRNTPNTYGLIAVALHWLVAAIVVGMFALGLWMVDLNLYHPWYHRAPDLHKSIGVLLFAVMLLRLGWRLANPRPLPAPGVTRLEARAAAVAHVLLYILLFAVMIAGYLISTADGRAVEVFGLFGVPATVTGIEDQEDIAGDVHLVLAVILVSLAGLHALAALKHHFIDRDRTLLRMLGRNHPSSANETNRRSTT